MTNSAKKGLDRMNIILDPLTCSIECQPGIVCVMIDTPWIFDPPLNDTIWHCPLGTLPLPSPSLPLLLPTHTHLCTCI
jgi:hypothetical protein